MYVAWRLLRDKVRPISQSNIHWKKREVINAISRSHASHVHCKLTLIRPSSENGSDESYCTAKREVRCATIA